MKKKIISSLPALRPSQIIDVTTGEIISLSEHDAVVVKLVEYVQSEVQRNYSAHGAQLEQEISSAKSLGSANSFGRQRGYASNAMTLGKEIKARSRINELVLHKLVSETASYVRNPNPRKQPPSFAKKINLGAVDKQMASLSLDNNVLSLLFKVWDRELLIDFIVPQYVFSKNILKWSLPSIEVTKNGVEYRFSVQESVTPRVKSANVAGLDLGRVEPFTMVVINKSGSRIADYTVNGRVRQLNAKREQILKEKAYIFKKVDQYDKLGLDATVLREEADRKAVKASRLVNPISLQVAADVARKLQNHDVHLLAVEDLRWATGSKYGSKWSFSQAQSSIEHSTARVGVEVKKVNPKNTSQECHVCGVQVIHASKTRVVKCVDCKTAFDRDYNAAMNIAKKLIPYPDRYSRLGGNCSATAQVINQSGYKSKSRKRPTNVAINATIVGFVT